MEFPSGGIASAPGRIFCFLIDMNSTLSSDSGFLFFTSAAWVCLSCKLHGMALGGIATGPCVLGV